MDTQRIILFIVFSFSCFLLWGEWQKTHAPVQPAAQQAAPAAGQSAAPAKDLPAGSKGEL